MMMGCYSRIAMVLIACVCFQSCDRGFFTLFDEGKKLNRCPDIDDKRRDMLSLMEKISIIIASNNSDIDHSPEQKQMNVSMYAPIILDFGEEMDVYSDWVVIINWWNYTGESYSIYWDNSDSTLVIHPYEPLPPGATIHVDARGFVALNGDRFERLYFWFYTEDW